MKFCELRAGARPDLRADFAVDASATDSKSPIIEPRLYKGPWTENQLHLSKTKLLH